MDFERVIHSTKTALACAIGVLVGKYIYPDTGQWVVITILIVMCAQIYVGSVISKSILRLLGTLAGSIVGALCLIFFGQTLVAVLGTLVISSFVFSYIATAREDLMYAGTLGAATIAIILLFPNSTIDTAIERSTEISTGIIIAMLVSQFILPIHARSHLRRVQAKTLELIKSYFLKIISPTQGTTLALEDLDEIIAKSLIKQRQLAKESAKEPLGISFNRKNFIYTLQLEKAMLRSISFIHQALKNLKDAEQVVQQPEMKTVIKKIITAFDTIITRIDTPHLSTTLTIHLPPITALEQALVSKFAQDSSQAIYLDSLLFALETMMKSLKEVAELFMVTVEETT